MNATLASTAHQQKRIKAYRDGADSYSFFNLLTSDELIEKVEELLPEHRERLFPPLKHYRCFWLKQ